VRSPPRPTRRSARRRCPQNNATERRRRVTRIGVRAAAARRQRGPVPRSQATGSRLALAARRRAGRTLAARPWVSGLLPGAGSPATSCLFGQDRTSDIGSPKADNTFCVRWRRAVAGTQTARRGKAGAPRSLRSWAPAFPFPEGSVCGSLGGACRSSACLLACSMTRDTDLG
jgi:hypothetical protein